MSKHAKLEVLAPISKPTVPAAVGQAIEQLVQQKVAEALEAKGSRIFEPWFRSKREANELRRLQTVAERKKWGLYYERHGCLHCHTDKRPHASNGLCHRCRGKITHQLEMIIQELGESRR